MTDKAPIPDDEILALIKGERIRSIGFEETNSSELQTERQRGLEYFKGLMTDMEVPGNRSSAVTSDVADAIRTLLPDLLDIFTGGEDVATFVPRGEDDEAAAKQETDYIRNVVFQQNDGFTTIATMIMDALQSKIGVATYYWEDYEPEEELLEGKTLEEAQGIHMQANPAPVPGQKTPTPPFEIVEITQGDEPGTYDITIQKPTTGRICVKSIPPEDFSVAQDTIRLPDATYCAMRSRPRAQQLIADGYGKDVIDQLPAYGLPADDITELARDTAGEHLAGQQNDTSTGELRQVEILENYIRIRDGKRIDIWRVVTGAGETVLLKKEKVNRIQFAGITPYPVPHRFYGQSVADLLVPVQRISTAVTRGHLDSIYFALNQRAEISDTKSSENTLADFLRNEPGVPIRSKTGDAVRGIEAGAPNVDFLEALEYWKTVAEQRTGVVRNAQGLNPDTLHDTAKGALALMSAALRRMRLIARNFAETGLKDLYLGVHALIREHSSQADQVRMAGTWVTVDPSTWGERADMTIEVGLGSGGKDQTVAMLLQQMDAMQKVIEVQQGAEGPVVTWENVYALAIKLFEATGSKSPEAFVTNPKDAPPKPPAPNPDAAKAQADMQKAQMQAQLDGQKLQSDNQAKAAQFQLDEMKLKLQADNDAHQRDLASQKLNQDYSLAQQDFDVNSSLKLAAMNAQFKTSVTVAQIKANAEAFRAHVDLTIQASEHDHQQTMQAADHEAQAAQAKVTNQASEGE